MKKDSTHKSPQKTTAAGKKAQDARKKKLEKALKDNLLRRKKPLV